MWSETLRLEMEIAPDVARISAARRVVDELTAHVASNEDVAWRLGMATHELLENVLKYGEDEGASVHLDFGVRDGARVASLRVRNRSRGDHIASLKRIVGAIQGAEDPWAFYLAAMEETSKKTEGSGLGLARIRAEGDMEIGLALEDDDYVCIEAQLALEDA